MSGFSTGYANRYLNYARGTAPATAPTALYVALYNGDPGDDGAGGTDITTTIAAARVVATFGAPASKAIANDAVVDFGAALADAHATHFGVWDATTAGNFIGGAALTTAHDITTGAPVQFDVGTLTIGF